MTCIITSLHHAIIVILIIATTVSSDDNIPAPAIKSEVNKWFANNIKPYEVRKGTLDPPLYEAEATRRTVKVRKDGTGKFKTVMQAIQSIPPGNKQRVIVDIGEGVYNEKITINRTKPFVTLYGSPGRTRPTLQFGGTAKQYGTLQSASLTVESDFFVARNLIIKNTAPKPDGILEGAQAVAFRLSGDKAAIYNCDFHGYQDTICDDKGRHFFYNCYIEGTIDFIFGSGKSLYLQTRIHALSGAKESTIIAAQARSSKLEDSGYSFVHCQITGDKPNSTFLGRYWIKVPEVVYAYTDMSNALKREAWENKFNPKLNGDILFGEYKNYGPGSSVVGRAPMSKQLDVQKAKYYISFAYIQASKWLLPPPFSKLI